MSTGSKRSLVYEQILLPSFNRDRRRDAALASLASMSAAAHVVIFGLREPLPTIVGVDFGLGAGAQHDCGDVPACACDFAEMHQLWSVL